jgi:crossover junction endodeoxyribonuclease RuvC
MYYLGVDQSLREPGIALVNEAGKVCVALSSKVGSTLRGGQRLAHIQKVLLDAVGSAQVHHAAMEGPSLNSTHREFDLGEVSGVVRATIFHSWAIEPLIVPPTQVKLFATGRGGASKEDVINAVNKGWELSTDNDNVADAIVLAQIARAVHSGQRCATRYQADVVVSLMRPPDTSRSRRKACTNL